MTYKRKRNYTPVSLTTLAPMLELAQKITKTRKYLRFYTRTIRVSYVSSRGQLHLIPRLGCWIWASTLILPYSFASLVWILYCFELFAVSFANFLCNMYLSSRSNFSPNNKIVWDGLLAYTPWYLRSQDWWT